MKDSIKLWCICWSITGDPCSGGKIINDWGTCLEILYCDQQMYPPSWWNPSYVTRYETEEEVVEELKKHDYYWKFK